MLERGCDVQYVSEAVDAAVCRDTERFTITVPDELLSFQAEFHDSCKAACLEHKLGHSLLSVVSFLCSSSARQPTATLNKIKHVNR